MAIRRLSEQEIQQIIEMRKTGTPRKDIAVAFGVPVSRIKDIFIKYGVTVDMETAQRNAYNSKLVKNPNAMQEMRKNIDFKYRAERTREAYQNSPELVELKRQQTTEWWANMDERYREEYLDKRHRAFAESSKVNAYFNRSGVDGLDPATSFLIRVQERGGRALGEYVGSKTKVSVMCSEGHVFGCLPNGLQQEIAWCPQCTGQMSSGQLQVCEFVKSITSHEVLLCDRKLIYPKELDIFIPTLRFAIEYDGLFWHSSAMQNYDRAGSFKKWQKCKEKGVQLVSIFEDEWMDSNKRELIKDMIKAKLGVLSARKLNARSLDVIEVSRQEANEFFDANHISGSVNHKYAIGLTLDKQLVCCASFRENFNDEFELARFATLRGHLVRGGLSRILAHCKEDEVVSFSDNRLSVGKVYEVTGFTNITEKGATNSYYYTDCLKRYWRFKCRRVNDPNILAKYPTEEAQALGGILSQRLLGVSKPMYRVDDAGHQKWIFRKGQACLPLTSPLP
jgi:hypothetical protein